MKRGVIFFSIFALFVLFSLNVSAQGSLDSCEAGDQNCKINLAQLCLDEKIGDCSSLTSSDDKVFSLLATGQCSNEVEGDSKFKTNVKYTSQAILGLSGSSRTDARDWLITKNKTSENLEWYLQIDIPNFPEGTTTASCTVKNSGNTASVTINEDRTISISSSSSCISSIAGPPASSQNYWLVVNPSCYGEELNVSCDQGFLTSLLYTASNSDTVYVSDTTQSGSVNGETLNKVESMCFTSGTGTTCDYESTLWGAMALDSMKEDITSYLPYLISLKDDNSALLPESFLQSMTDAFRAELLSKQVNNQYWSVSGNNYFDTALALLPFRVGETPQEKTNSINWLLDHQTIDGCWNNNNIKDTAFILYSVFSTSGSSGTGGDTSISCTEAGFFCRSNFGCTNDGGSILSDYTCSTGSVCCSTQVTSLTCSEQNGQICASGQQCSGTRKDASGLSTGEICCIGTCTTPKTTSTQNSCELGGGSCRSTCSSSESETNLECDVSFDKCCLPKTESPGSKTGIIWIIILLILITLTVVGIIFREKLKVLVFRLKSRFRKGGSSATQKPKGPPGFPPFSPSGPRPSVQRRAPLLRRPAATTTARRILPQQRSAGTRARKPGEFDEVLKKLKEMGK